MEQKNTYDYDEIEKIFRQWSIDFCEQEEWHSAICLNAAQSIIRRVASLSRNEPGVHILPAGQVATLNIVKNLAAKRYKHCAASRGSAVSIADGGLYDLYIMSTRDLAEEARAVLDWCDTLDFDHGRNPGPDFPVLNRPF